MYRTQLGSLLFVRVLVFGVLSVPPRNTCASGHLLSYSTLYMPGSSGSSPMEFDTSRDYRIVSVPLSGKSRIMYLE